MRAGASAAAAGRAGLAGRERGGSRRAAVLGPYVEEVVAELARRGRRALAAEDPHLAGVVPRQEVLEGVPATAHAHHHVPALQQLRTRKSASSLYMHSMLRNSPGGYYFHGSRVFSSEKASE